MTRGHEQLKLGGDSKNSLRPSESARTTRGVPSRPRYGVTDTKAQLESAVAMAVARVLDVVPIGTEVGSNWWIDQGRDGRLMNRTVREVIVRVRWLEP